MLFWGGVYITLSPLTSDSTYALPVEDFTIDVEPSTNDIATWYKTYIRQIFQVGLRTISLITHMFGLLVILCFGNEIDSVTTYLCPSPSGNTTDDGFLARLDAALTLGGILTKGYAITSAVIMYLVNPPTFPTFPEVSHRRRELCGKRFQTTNGIEAGSDEKLGVCHQAGSKFLQGLESGYASTGEDEINGE